MENIPDKGAFLLISNHQSFLDPLFCGTPLRREMTFVARNTLLSNWFSRSVLTSVGVIPIKRGRADLSAIKKILKRLKDGRGVCLFPEATRTQDGKIASLKAGFGFLCRRAQTPIVPVVIEGAFKCWPRHKKVFIPGSHILINYGKAITVKKTKNMDENELAEYLTNVLRQMQNKSRRKRKLKPYDYSD